SLHRYVQDQRLERAASLITEGGMNVSEAAIKSGYTNMSHFAKEFQKKFGITPKKFSKLL
ncbi:MAG: helix-turn-helix transcriptional regulator, partial [Treponema sp.]|nr:helix-turn-helix transcriptional regulator [Treponema sp.]